MKHIVQLTIDSIFIFDNLELWWERTKNGFKVIDEIMNLIQNYSNNFIFLINCNIHTFNLMNQIKPIADNFISIINCEPFDAEKIKDVILLRHQSSGMKFKFNKKTEENVNQLKLAGLFNKYFEYSQGNIGVALNAWVSNIEKIRFREITIKKPKNINFDILQNIDQDYLIYINQFILHKNMTTEKLSRILQIDKNETVTILLTLKRAGIININSKNIYSLNSYLKPYLTKTCIEKEIL